MSMHRLHDILHKTQCSLEDVSRQKRLFYLFIPVIVGTHAFFFVGYGNVTLLSILKDLFPETVTGPLVPDNAWVAALMEPWFSKWLPIAAVVAGGLGAVLSYLVGVGTFLAVLFLIGEGLVQLGFHSVILISGVSTALTYYITVIKPDIQSFTCLPLFRHRWTAGALVGLTFGIEEANRKMVIEDGFMLRFFWEYPSFHPTVVAPIFYHVFEGLVVVGIYLTVIRSSIPFWRKVAITVAGILLTTLTHLFWNTWLAFNGCYNGWCFWVWWAENFGVELLGFVSAMFALGIWVLKEADTTRHYTEVRA